MPKKAKGSKAARSAPPGSRSEVERFALLYECASRHYVDGQTREELAERYERDVSTIARWLSDARREHIVEYRVVPRLPEPFTAERDRDCEDRLKSQFGLQQCVVLGGLTETFWARSATDPHMDFVENYLHALIAFGFATFIAATRFRKDDHIGVGGGRGNWFWAHYMPTSDWSEGQVTALAAQTASQLWGQVGVSIDHSMDADFVAQRLCGATGARPNVVGLPVAPIPIPVERPPQLRGDYWEDKTRIPNIVVMGVGTMTGSHRFMLSESFNFKGVEKPLSRLVKKIHETETYPVGERLNRLFYAGAAPGEQPLDSRTEDEFKELIAEVNADTLSISDSQLSQIDEAWIVSGGTRKVHTIRTALGELANASRNLCVDLRTGHQLLTA